MRVRVEKKRKRGAFAPLGFEPAGSCLRASAPGHWASLAFDVRSSVHGLLKCISWLTEFLSKIQTDDSDSSAGHGRPSQRCACSRVLCCGVEGVCVLRVLRWTCKQERRRKTGVALTLG